MSKTQTKVYIGDGVYAEYDGMGVWLTTERENGTHMIYLEPPMVERIVETLDALGQWSAASGIAGRRGRS